MQGIEAGQGFVYKAQQEQDRRQQLQISQQREDRRDRMEQAHVEFMDRNEQDRNRRDAWKEAYDMHKEVAGEMETEGNALRARFTGPDGKLDMNAANADPAYQDYAKRVQKLNQGRDALMDSAYGPFLKQGIDRANEYSQGLVKQNDPKFDLSNPDNAQDLHHMVSVCSRQDPANFLKGPNNTDSLFEEGAANIHNGFSNSDAQSLYTGVDRIFGNQFEAGRLGYMDPLGGTVTSARLNQDRPFVPTPDGSAMHPVMDVGGETEGGFTRQPAAPPTMAGFDHPENTNLMSFTPQKAFDNLGAMGTLQKLLSHPVIQTNLAKACAEPDQFNKDWAQAYTARGNKPSLGGLHFTRENPEDGTVSQMYAPYVPGGGVGAAQEIVNSRGLNKPSAAKAVPEALQEADQVVKDQVINKDTGQPFKTPGEYMAAKARGLNPAPNEANVKLQSDLTGELTELEEGQMRNPLSPTGYVEAAKRDSDGNPMMDDDGNPIVDKGIQASIDARKKALQARLKQARTGATLAAPTRRFSGPASPEARCRRAGCGRRRPVWGRIRVNALVRRQLRAGSTQRP